MFTEFFQGGYFHVYARGVDKRPIYIDDEDRQFFLSLMRRFQKVDSKCLVAIEAFCLMDNHYHMLIRQIGEGGVTKFMRKLLTAYVMYFNRKYTRTGTLFESTFKRKWVNTDGYLGNTVRYIHLNAKDLMTKETPTPKDILNFIESYEWSDVDGYIKGKGGLSSFFYDLSYRDFLYSEILFPRSDLKEGFEVGPQN